LIVLSSGSLHTYGLPRVFDLAARVGFDGIELMVDAPNDNRNASYLRRLSDAHALPIAAVHSPFVMDIPGWPADQMGRLERTVALAQELGAPLVVSHLPYRIYWLTCRWHGARSRRALFPVFWPRREAYYCLLRREDRLAQMEADTGVIVAIENMPARRLLGMSLPLYWFNRLDELARFPHLTLDTTHVGTWGLDLLDVWDALGARVAHVHLSNYDGREHRLPTDGRLALDSFLHRLAEDGFRGAVSVECGPEVFGAEDAGACLANLERTLAFCREHFSVAPDVVS
jgi:sugar phosphate isomerase/epimerase